MVLLWYLTKHCSNALASMSKRVQRSMDPAAEPIILGSYCLKVTQAVKVDWESRITGFYGAQVGTSLCGLKKSHTCVACSHLGSACLL